MGKSVKRARGVRPYAGTGAQAKPRRRKAAPARQFIHIEITDGMFIVHAQLANGGLGDQIVEALRVHFTPTSDIPPPPPAN